MAPRTDWAALTLAGPKDRRKSKRVPLSFPIAVSGFDRSGRFFSERTSTVEISESGCRIRLKTRLERGEVVAIKLCTRRAERSPENKPLLFQIVWSERDGDFWIAGALKLQAENIWHMAFPPAKRPKASPP